MFDFSAIKLKKSVVNTNAEEENKRRLQEEMKVEREGRKVFFQFDAVCSFL